MFSLLLALPSYATECSDWNARLAVSPTPGHASAQLSLAWSPVPEGCGSFTFDHYAACWNDAAADELPRAPAGPDEADHCADVSVQRAWSQARLWVHRSDRAFAVTVFACGDAACTTWYGDDAEVRNHQDGAVTAKERWVLRSVSSFDDTDRAIADNGANAVSSLFYGPGFGDVGHLALWYSTGAGGVENIRQVRAETAGWHDFNDTSWTEPVEVAASAGEHTGAFGHVTHPWVVPAVEDGVPYVRMYLQADDDGDNVSGEQFRIWSVDSLDDAGTDFGLACEGSDCDADGASCDRGDLCDWDDASGDGGAAFEEVANGGDADDAWITSAAHGRVVWSPLDDRDGAIDFDSDRPMMLFSGTAESCLAPPDDLLAGTWDGSAWEIPTAGSCPDVQIDDAHDPGVMPLPGGSFKAYVQIGADAYEVCYYEDGAWTDCAEVEIAFDDGTMLGELDPSLGACTDNFDALAHRSGGRLHEGGFLHAFTGGDCFAEGEGGILFAEHRN